MGSEDAGIQAYYMQGREWDRLDDPKGVVEFERTKEILHRRLPAAPAVIADIGGGPGRYALWLAELGYTVEHRDLVRLHVEQLQASSGSLVRAEVGDGEESQDADERGDRERGDRKCRDPERDGEEDGQHDRDDRGQQQQADSQSRVRAMTVVPRVP
jgi:hypothetical protein